MSTFARIVDGYALDCQVADSLDALAARFHPAWLARNPFVQVPDGTTHGARDNGNGTFTNPPVVDAPSSAPEINPLEDLRTQVKRLSDAIIAAVPAAAAAVAEAEKPDVK